jgi:hypothetical protein
VSPIGVERCNGRDDNCDGQVDEPSPVGHVDCPGRRCVNAICTPECLPGFDMCGGNCIDLRTDRFHCGACMRFCRSEGGEVPRCEQGICACAAGETGCSYQDPDLRQTGTVCVNPQTSRFACGGCANIGNACSDNGDCRAGVCTCRAGFIACPGVAGTCVNATSLDNCGRCGNVCSPPSDGSTVTCDGECRCRDANNVSGTLCGSRCLHLEQDPMNCGRCGNVCPAGTSRCVSGVCAPCGILGAVCCEEVGTACGMTAACDRSAGDPRLGMCVSCGRQGERCCLVAGIPTCGPDGYCGIANNCVSCGRLGQICCPRRGAACIEGGCNGATCVPCGAGETMCAGICVNTQTNAMHCGRCGTVCPVGAACVAGACR